MQKTGRIALALSMLFSISGCASFVAQATGSEPLGTDSGVRSFPQVLTDNAIERTAKINMYKLDPRFKFARVNVVSYYGVVLLTGQVSDPYLKQLAEDNLKAMTDVKAVQNYIDVGDKISYETIMQDALTTADIRRKLLTTKGISDNKVRVQTENGVVYVLGKLTPSENLALVNILQNTPNINRVVSLIDNLSESGVPTGNDALTTTNNNGGQQLVQPGSNSVVTTPLVETPVAVDPEQAPPDQPSTAIKASAMP